MFSAEVVKRKRVYFAPFVFVQKSCGCWDSATSEREGSAMSHCVLGFLLIYTVGSAEYATATPILLLDGSAKEWMSGEEHKPCAFFPS